MVRYDDMKRIKYLPVAVSLMAGFVLLNGCGTNKIRSGGLKYAQIGSAMPKAKMIDLAGRPASDSLLHEGRFTWRATRVDYEDGFVLIEEDFSQDDVVNRIRVETPSLKFKKGIAVGISAQDLARTAKEWTVTPFPEYQLLEAVSQKFPGIVFLLTAPHLDFQGQLPESVDIHSLPENSLLDKIVIM